LTVRGYDIRYDIHSRFNNTSTPNTYLRQLNYEISICIPNKHNSKTVDSSSYLPAAKMSGFCDWC